MPARRWRDGAWEYLDAGVGPRRPIPPPAVTVADVYPVDGTARDVIGWVGDNVARALVARARERERPRPRSGVLSHTDGVLR